MMASPNPTRPAMTRVARLAAVLAALAVAAPAAAQQAPAPVLAPAAWDARLTPPPVAPLPSARAGLERALPRPVAGVGYVLLGSGLMWVTKQAEGDEGEDGVPFIPLLSGTMGAMTFWYGVYHLVTKE
jgi:hypothetical protein